MTSFIMEIFSRNRKSERFEVEYKSDDEQARARAFFFRCWLRVHAAWGWNPIFRRRAHIV